MVLVVLVSGFLAVNLVAGAVRAFREKRWLEGWSMALLIPFCVFMPVTACLGGSAFNQAQTEYELFRQGQYYLMSHGAYTEVTYGTYILAAVLEVVGCTSFVAGVLLNVVRLFLRKKDT